MTADTEIQTATNVKCPECIRKLCKLREYNDTLYVEIKHKGAFVLAVEAVIGCIDCGRTYRVNAETQEIIKVEI